MNPNRALEQLQASIDHHNLTGWSGGLDTAVKRFGVCNISKKHISLSRKLCELNSDEEVTDTILHEIAHALAFERHGENCGHDHRWKSICVEIGARPEACYDNNVVQPDAPWQLVHKTTGEVFRSYYKKPRRKWGQVWIRGRKQETYGQLTIRASNNMSSPASEQSESVAAFTPQTVLDVQEGLVAVVKEYAKANGLQLSGARSKYSSHQCDLTLSLTVPETEATKDHEKYEFEALAPLFDLTGNDYLKPFSLNGRRFTLVGLKPNNRKYPIIGADETGRRFKFTLDVIEQFHTA